MPGGANERTPNVAARTLTADDTNAFASVLADNGGYALSGARASG